MFSLFSNNFLVSVFSIAFNPIFWNLTARYGGVLVVSSTYALGFTGTYLGDYFGILMKERVTSFPFNVVEHPMYIGSTLNFLGFAIYYRSMSGYLLTIWVALCYVVASKYEQEFTSMIYSNASKAKEAQNKED
ncbi:Phosphatidyl-N-methylethanolamine N-methyltransferase [Smittium mucronatum]|uniref:Phosphatidyl-N-methylethanolamine N-methyltransferase n=1 Tax=Smittium mucronatum TaxID=133383 RepID=A0A1R0H4X0_9FUNG|nr:Phosphatidyl-N-methylethanolamine N-methyltransferase [Smittium mucronatum]